MRLLILMFLIAFSAPALAVVPADLEARSAWSQAQTVLRMTAAITVKNEGQADREYRVSWERTPHNRQLLILRTPDASQVIGNLIQQDQLSVIVGTDGTISPMAAPWQTALVLIGEPIEPATAISWILGLPGEVPSVDFAVADLTPGTDGRLQTLEQGGWSIQYAKWSPADATRPSLPQTLVMSRNKTTVTVDIQELIGFTTAPEGYQEMALQ